MLRSEMLELIASGENSGVEFKRDDVRPEQLAKEIVALANLQGGCVLLGVEDDGSISGIQRDDLERWVMDTVFGRYVHPMILPFYEEIALDDGRRVAAISITQGTSKPYVLRANGREEIYVRIGSISRLATREQQARLFDTGGMLHAELQPVSGADVAHLDNARLTDYLANVLGELDIPTARQPWLSRLTNLGFMIERPQQGHVCTIAGLVLFGRVPRRSLRQAGIRWMSFTGLDRDYDARDDAIVDGPLVALWEGRPGQGRRVVEPGLLENLASRTLPFLAPRVDRFEEGLRRDRDYLLPLDAFREAVLNGLVHRDWTRSLDVEVVAYADRLEVMSPGALPNTMTIEKMIAGQRSPRNPIIAEVMRDYGYVEMRGMGVRRKIVPLSREFTGRDATFEATEDFVRVGIPLRRS